MSDEFTEQNKRQTMAPDKDIGQILIRYSDADFDSRLQGLYDRLDQASRFGSLPGLDSEETNSVKEILRAVGERGDAAVREYTARFDGVDLEPWQFAVPEEEIQRAHDRTDPELLRSFKAAIENVRKYQHDIFNGNRKHAGLRYNPVERVGICVPGASAPLPSTVIMTAVPAMVAGVGRIAVVSPPRHQGSIHPAILAVCRQLEITEVYRVGGAQAIAALAAGTATIPRVNIIVGPGNKYVQTAKKMVAGDYVGIDSIAGPSEVLIIADGSARAEWVAADMLSQAEHADDSCAVVLTDSASLAEGVLQQLKTQLGQIDRGREAMKSLRRLGAVVLLDSLEKAVEMADRMAFEHLQIQCGPESRAIAERINNAGAIFIGPYTPVAVGDYWAGPSHTLPTGRRAMFSSALTANDFVKSISIVEYDRGKLAAGAEDIVRLAEIEGLGAHARSVKIRLED